MTIIQQRPLSDWLSDAGEWAKDFLLGAPGRQLPALMVVIDAEGAVTNYSALFGSERDKTGFSHLMKSALLAHQATAYIYMAETWQVRLKPGETATCQPKDHPARREMVCAYGRTRTEFQVACWMIHRDESGAICSLTPEQSQPPTSFTGRFLPEFPPEILIPENSEVRQAFTDLIDLLLEAYPFRRFHIGDPVEEPDRADLP